MTPLSVVMPVRNARPYLDQSISSVLGQTFGDFELVIRDDGSTDGSREVLRAWARRDRRIRLHEDDRPLGPAGSSNWVVAHSDAPFVARMDADDVAHPDRLRRQLAVLRAHADVDVVGALSDAVDQHGRRIRPPDRGMLARSSSHAPFEHGSMMFRRSAFERVGGYRERCAYWEDLDLLLRIARDGRIVVLPDVLYTYRYGGTSTRLTSDQELVEAALDLMFRCVAEHERAGSYEHLLAGGTPEQLLPRAIRAYGTLELWTGRTPSLVPRLLRRAEVRLDADTATSLVWTAWA
ncbi:MAG: glycosyltransferase family 2 protein, partial [Actinomycetota bacterium]|nr:glycosyltransferase family 2 protein [Actinomycetota bacterium]